MLDTISDDRAIGAGTAGLLTSLPVLCFGLATPLAAWLLGRTGLERGVLLALAGVLVDDAHPVGGRGRGGPRGHPGARTRDHRGRTDDG